MGIFDPVNVDRGVVTFYFARCNDGIVSLDPTSTAAGARVLLWESIRTLTVVWYDFRRYDYGFVSV